MKSKELPPEHWHVAFRRITETSDGKLITVRHLKTNGVTDTVAEALPLRSILLDEQSDPCNNRIVVEAGSADRRPIQHVIIEPIHVRLRTGENDRYHRMDIVAEDGTTELELRPGLNPSLFELPAAAIPTH